MLKNTLRELSYPITNIFLIRSCYWLDDGYIYVSVFRNFEQFSDWSRIYLPSVLRKLPLEIADSKHNNR